MIWDNTKMDNSKIIIRPCSFLDADAWIDTSLLHRKPEIWMYESDVDAHIQEWSALEYQRKKAFTQLDFITQYDHQYGRAGYYNISRWRNIVRAMKKLTMSHAQMIALIATIDTESSFLLQKMENVRKSQEKWNKWRFEY